MKKNFPLLVVANPEKAPKPEPGTPEFASWLLEEAKKDRDFYFRADAPQIDLELEQGLLCGDFVGLSMSEMERHAEDDAVEAEQRAHAVRHLKPV